MFSPVLKIGGPSLALTCVLLLGCSSGDESAGISTTRIVGDGPPRYARLFNSLTGREWKLESEHVKLQESAFMNVWEVSGFAPGTEPTPEQTRAADDLAQRCFEAAVRHGWFDYETGLADGYHALPGDRQHHRRNEFLLDDAILDPDRPEVLMYYDTPEGHKLAGFMFQASSRFERGPQIGGPLTVWHYHVWKGMRCVDAAGSSSGFAQPGEECKSGHSGFHRSYEMLHVWLIDRHDGPFSTGMKVQKQELTRALKKRMREHGL